MHFSKPAAQASKLMGSPQQLHALKQHYKGLLKLHDFKEMFVQMRDQAS
jgi:hypothetical protein